MKVRIVVSALVAIGLALGTSGCNLIQPQATTQHYDASDGIGVDVGDIDLRNLIVISDNGTSGSLMMSAINTTGSDVLLNVEFESDGVMVGGRLKVPYSQQPTSWGSTPETQLILEGINTEPGAMLKVYFQYGEAEGKSVLIPVLTSGQPEYRGLEPASVIRLGNK